MMSLSSIDCITIASFGLNWYTMTILFHHIKVLVQVALLIGMCHKVTLLDCTLSNETYDNSFHRSVADHHQATTLIVTYLSVAFVILSLVVS